MKTLKHILFFGFVLAISAQGATFPSRFTTNIDGTLIDGSVLTNVFRTNWISTINTTPLSKTNFTDLQFNNKGIGNVAVSSWGAQADDSAVLSGSGNRASGWLSVVCGGRGGVAGGVASFIGSSNPNTGNQALGTAAAIVNGTDCYIDTLSQNGFIGNGNDSLVYSKTFGTIVNCNNGVVTGTGCFVGGGQNNGIGDNLPIYGGDFSAIVGGIDNLIHADVTNCFIGGGSNNVITTGGNRSFIVAGINNSISGSNSAAIGSNLSVSSNNVVAVGIGAHKFEIGPTGLTNADGYFGPNGQQTLAVWTGNTGGQAIAAATSAFYAPQGNSATNVAVADVTGFTRAIVTRTVVLANLYAIRQTAGGIGHTTTVTIFTNGVASNIQASLNNSTTGNDTTHTVTILAGTEVGIKIITPASDTPSNHSWAFELR